MHNNESATSAPAPRATAHNSVAAGSPVAATVPALPKHVALGEALARLENLNDSAVSLLDKIVGEAQCRETEPKRDGFGSLQSTLSQAPDTIHREIDRVLETLNAIENALF